VARCRPSRTVDGTERIWTMIVEEGGRSHEVVIIGSMGSNPGYTAELDAVENLFRQVLAEQESAAGVG
jgi:hypothetical protein